MVNMKLPNPQLSLKYKLTLILSWLSLSDFHNLVASRIRSWEMCLGLFKAVWSNSMRRSQVELIGIQFQIKRNTGSAKVDGLNRKL